jgi:hypothetical protein
VRRASERLDNGLALSHTLSPAALKRSMVSTPALSAEGRLGSRELLEDHEVLPDPEDVLEKPLERASESQQRVATPTISTPEPFGELDADDGTLGSYSIHSTPAGEPACFSEEVACPLRREMEQERSPYSIRAAIEQASLVLRHSPAAMRLAAEAGVAAARRVAELTSGSADDRAHYASVSTNMHTEVTLEELSKSPQGVRDAIEEEIRRSGSPCGVRLSADLLHGISREELQRSPAGVRQAIVQETEMGWLLSNSTLEDVGKNLKRSPTAVRAAPGRPNVRLRVGSSRVQIMNNQEQERDSLGQPCRPPPISRRSQSRQPNNVFAHMPETSLAAVLCTGPPVEADTSTRFQQTPSHGSTASWSETNSVASYMPTVVHSNSSP